LKKNVWHCAKANKATNPETPAAATKCSSNKPSACYTIIIGQGTLNVIGALVPTSYMVMKFITMKTHVARSFRDMFGPRMIYKKTTSVADC
jgi:hypothetical protein